MLDRMTDSLDFQGRALQLRAERQQVLAANIANADTPGFKARDIDFRKALERATGESPAGGATLRAKSPDAGSVTPSQAATNGIARTHESHLARLPGSTLSTGAPRAYTNPEQASVDGNTVDLNRERANFADNAIRYEATLRFINGRVRTMLTAIRGE